MLDFLCYILNSNFYIELIGLDLNLTVYPQIPVSLSITTQPWGNRTRESERVNRQSALQEQCSAFLPTLPPLPTEVFPTRRSRKTSKPPGGIQFLDPDEAMCSLYNLIEPCACILCTSFYVFFTNCSTFLLHTSSDQTCRNSRRKQEKGVVTMG